MFGMFLDLNLQARLDCQIVRMHPKGRYDAAKPADEGPTFNDVLFTSHN